MLESFRAARWVRTLNLVLQVLLFLSFFGGLNYVARNHPQRFDLTKHRKFSLSPETLSYLKNLQRPVHIIVTTSPESDNPEVKGLIDEYYHATLGSSVAPITREFVDIYQNRRKSEELQLEQPDLIVILSGDSRRVVTVNELYTMKNKKRDAFRGEQVLTAAILGVVEPTPKVYFLAGHGEFRVDITDPATGLSVLRDQLRQRNYEIDTLDLTTTRKIPADAAVLIAVNPINTFSRSEQELLRRYLSENAGRLILFLGHSRSTINLGLDELLLDWGVLVHYDMICDLGPENVTDNGELIIRPQTTHPITKTLADNGLPLRFPTARTVMPDPGRGSGLNTVTLAGTSPTAWGERSFHEMPKYDPGVDTRPLPGMDPPNRLGVAVASERLAVRDNLPFSVRGGKLVVFGTGELVVNGRIDQASLLVTLNAVNWAVDRDRELSIPPRPLERFQVSLSAADFARLRYSLLFGLPGAALALGLVVYWTRRR